MKIVTANVDLDLRSCRVDAYTPTVLADGAALKLKEAVTAQGLPLRVSGMGHYTRHYCGQTVPAGSRLLVWRGCGLGDQLMASAVVRGLLAARPELRGRIDLYGHPKVTAALWEGVEDLPFRPMAEPIPLSAWREYAAHLVLADMCEADAEPDQGHTVDRMLWAAGVDPGRVPDEAKRPCVPATVDDARAAMALLRELLGADDAAPFLLWQLGSSTPIRSYRPDLARRAMALTMEALPGRRLLATGTDAEFAEYEPIPDGVVAIRGQSIRTVFALVALADCVVAPDSVLAHAAGGLRRPCVGLWGSFSPAWRAAYYPEHWALVGRAPEGGLGGVRNCAPCGTHEVGRQPLGCPLLRDLPPDERYCRAIAGITPDAIAAAVTKACGAHNQTQRKV